MFFSQIDKKAAVCCVPVFSKWEAKFDEVLPIECQPQVQGTQVTVRKNFVAVHGEKVMQIRSRRTNPRAKASNKIAKTAPTHSRNFVRAAA